MPKYSASAECVEESIVMVLAKEFVQDVADADPVNGMRFYKRLARMLGNRLIHNYQGKTEGVVDGYQFNLETSNSIESQQDS